MPSVPFFQIYCLIWALYPIQTSNLQALNGIGRSDLFLRLEVVKKVYSVAILCFSAFVLRDVYAVVLGIAITSVLSCFVNAFPSRKVICYGYREQVRDLAPAFLLTGLCLVIAWPISLADIPPMLTIVAQGVVVAVIYLFVAKLLKVEELEYLIATLKELRGERKR